MEKKLNIATYSSHTNINPNDIKGKTVVCIDVFCSSTTLLGAFKNGLKRVLVIDDPIEAPTYKHRLNDDRILMGGANRFKPITGLDVSDSFLDYSNKAVSGKELIYSNENFAPTIRKCKRAKKVFVGGIVNSYAVANKIVNEKNDVALVCCGDDGSFALEDGLAAGAIISDIVNLNKDFSLTEYSFVIDLIYKRFQSDLLEVLKQSRAYNELLNLGHYDDISLALEKDKYDFVPTLHDNWITVLD